MPKFNIDEYDTVDSRLQKFRADHPKGCVISKIIETMSTSDSVLYYAEVYFDMSDDRPAGADCAWGQRNVDNYKDVDYASWHENASTSAIGRALADAGYKAKIDSPRPSREEMEKVGSGQSLNEGVTFVRRGPAPVATDEGETFEGPASRYMKTNELVEMASAAGFRGKSTASLRSEVEQTFKVKIKGSGENGGVFPYEVANAIIHFQTAEEKDDAEVPF